MQAELKAAFEAFANFGTRQPTTEIDGAKFAKLCKECKLLDKAFTATVLRSPACDQTCHKLSRHARFPRSFDSCKAASNIPLRAGCGSDLLQGTVLLFVLAPIDEDDLSANNPMLTKLSSLQVKAKAARKIGFKEFQAAVEMIAEKKKISVEDLTAKIVAAGGPASNSTKAEACKFHDDKSLYTGVRSLCYMLF